VDANVGCSLVWALASEPLDTTGGTLIYPQNPGWKTLSYCIDNANDTVTWRWRIKLCFSVSPAEGLCQPPSRMTGWSGSEVAQSDGGQCSSSLRPRICRKTCFSLYNSYVTAATWLRCWRRFSMSSDTPDIHKASTNQSSINQSMNLYSTEAKCF